MGLAFVDSTTPLNAANLNKLLQSDGDLGFACWAVRIYYTGSAWACSNDRGAYAQAANLSFNWSTNKLEINISGITDAFATMPVVVCVPAVGSTLVVNASATSTSNVDVQFRDYAGALVTTQATTMDFTMMIYGEV